MVDDNERADLAEVAARLRMAVVRTARRLRQESTDAGPDELTPTAIAALATIGRFGPLSPSELAAIERVKRPTVTRTLRQLAEAELITRSPDPRDGRSSTVAVTPGGRDLLRRVRRRKNAYLARRMRDLPAADVAALERAAAILEGLLEDHPGGAR